MCRVGEDRGQEPPGYLVEDTEQETGQDCPDRPHKVAAVGPDVDQTEDERGDHETELLLESPAKEGLLAYPGEESHQHEAGPVGAVHQAWGELLGYLAQNRQETIREEA